MAETVERRKLMESKSGILWAIVWDQLVGDPVSSEDFPESTDDLRCSRAALQGSNLYISRKVINNKEKILSSPVERVASATDARVELTIKGMKLSFWQTWHLETKVSTSSSVRGHQTSVRGNQTDEYARLRHFTIPWWPLWMRVITSFRSVAGMINR